MSSSALSSYSFNIVNKLIQYVIQRCLGPFLLDTNNHTNNHTHTNIPPLQVHCHTNSNDNDDNDDNDGNATTTSKSKCIEFEIRNIQLSAHELTRRFYMCILWLFQNNSHDDDNQSHSNSNYNNSNNIVVQCASIECIVIRVSMSSIRSCMSDALSSLWSWNNKNRSADVVHNEHNNSRARSPLEVKVYGLEIILTTTTHPYNRDDNIKSSSSNNEIPLPSIVFESDSKFDNKNDDSDDDDNDLDGDEESMEVEAGWVSRWLDYALSLLTVTMVDTRIHLHTVSSSSNMATTATATATAENDELQLMIHQICYGPDWNHNDTDMSDDASHNGTASNININININTIVQVSGIVLEALRSSTHLNSSDNVREVIRIPGDIRAVLRTNTVKDEMDCYMNVEVYMDTVDVYLCSNNLFILCRTLACVLSHMRKSTEMGLSREATEEKIDSSLPINACKSHSEESTFYNYEYEARKQPLVGGLLLQSSTVDNEESLLEAFYDATDQSMSKCMSFVGAVNKKGQLLFRLNLLEFRLQIALDNSATNAASNKNIAIVIRDTNVTANICETRKWVQLELSEVFVDASVQTDPATFFHLLHFVESTKPSDCVIPPSHIMLTVSNTNRLRRHGKEPTASRTEIELTLEPVEIIFHQDTISEVANIYHRCNMILTNTKQISSSNETNDHDHSLKFVSYCANLTLCVPVRENLLDDILLRDQLVLRKGVNMSHPFASLGISINAMTIDATSFTKESLALTTEGGKVFIVTDSLNISENKTRQRLDFINFSSEPELETESIIRIRIVPSDDIPSIFPSVPSIVSTDRKNEGSSGIRSKRPQETMLKNAIQCNTSLELSIPSLIIDLSLDERKYIISILNSILKSNDESSYDKSYSDANFSVGVVMQCQQLICILHEATHSTNNVESFKSFVSIFDVFRSHVCWSSKRGLDQARIISQDMTLYEAEYMDQPHQRTKGNHRFSCLQDTLPVVYRTHANASSIVMEKPCIHIDFSQSITLEESSIHVFLYDITYRYNLTSKWFWNLLSIIQGVRPTGTSVINDSNDSANASIASTDELTDYKMTKIFITVWDAVIDYTPPDEFTGCRAILHVGELHMSSNIIDDSLVLSFKICLSDVSGFLSDQKLPYHEDNRKLSCSLALLSFPTYNEKGYSPPRVPSIQEAFVSRGFVHVVSFDTVDSFVKLNRSIVSNSEPKLDLNLYLGLLTMYTCRDSFQLLTKIFGEWWAEFSSPSESELERIKIESSLNDYIDVPNQVNDSLHEHTDNPCDIERTSKLDMPEEQDSEVYENVPDSELSASELRRKHGVSDDTAPNLAKSLLIQDYYTLETSDAKDRTMTDELADIFTDEWANIDHDWLLHDFRPDEDQRALWFPTIQHNCDTLRERSRPLHIYPSHIPLSCAICDPLGQGDMNAASHAGLKASPIVSMRLVIHDMSACLRFFDGDDFMPQYSARKQSSPLRSRNNSTSRKDELLGALLETEYLAHADEKYKAILGDEFFSVSAPRHARDHNKYFEAILDRLRLRLDSFVDVPDHRLTSCLDLKVTSLFLSETISRGYPKKILGEWINDYEHPRDNNDGVLMLKMVSMQPTRRISSDGKLMADESRVALQLLPLRVNLDQHALTFVKRFFASDIPSSAGDDIEVGTFFQVFDVKACKLKVNYQPIGVDYNALKSGSYLELLNLFPLEDLDLELKNLSIQGLSGWSNVMNDILRCWVEDISSTQIHKFITRAAPVNAFTNIGNGAVNLVMLPVDQYKKERKFSRGIRKGASSFAKTVALETIQATSKISKHIAKTLDTPKLLPRRPGIPRNVREASSHSRSSVSQGIEVAARTIIAVPVREYNANGPSGAVKGVMKAIPIAVMAPLSGASEALSYTLLGARNQMRPDLYKEEEEMQRF